MPPPCSVCIHADREQIDRELAAGVPYRSVAQRCGLSEWAMYRHRQGHLLRAISTARRAEDVANGDDLLDQVVALGERAVSILGKAEAAENYGACAALLREARGCVTLLAELMQQIDRRPTLSLALAPEWQMMQAELLDALAPYPEARVAVAARLLSLEPA